MKKIFTVLISALFILLLSPAVFGESVDEEFYSDLFEGLPESVQEDFYKMGAEGISPDELMKISPGRIFSLIGDILRGEILTPLKTALCCLGIMLTVSLTENFFPDKSSLKNMGVSVGLMCIMFSLVSSAGEVFMDSCSVLIAVKDFMLLLIPVLAGVITAAGNPGLALSINTAVFTFAESVVGIFNKFIPVLSVSSTAAAAATAINPMMKFSGLGRIIPKTATVIMAFLSGIFVSVMSIRGIIAGAADTVTIKGLRFLVGSAVPVVGSAIGEALNSIAASLGLIRNTAGVFGIAAVCLTVLPAVIKILMWKFSLFFLGVAADMFDKPQIKGFCENMSFVFSLMFAALSFTSFVFIISIAIVLTVGRG